MLNDNLDLLKKYSTNLPRYTSFPTATALKEFSENDSILDLITGVLQGLSSSQPISLYIHLPYCPQLCYFCACNKIISSKTEDIDNYLSALEREIDLIKNILPLEIEIHELHLGGGSPSYLSISQLEKLELILSKLNISKICQKSIEIDPRTVDQEKLCFLYESSYKRFSLGVQDFDPTVQELINRIQSFELTAKTAEVIRTLSGTSINFDLIYGLPGQTQASFHDTISSVLELRPNRLALYGYAHVNWKVKVQNVLNKYGIPEDELRHTLFLTAAEKLIAAGYVHIGLDHFALPDDGLSTAKNTKTLRRNFMGYTEMKSDTLMALGVSAISDFGEYIFQNTANIEKFTQLLNAGMLPIQKYIKRNLADKIRAFIIETLMCNRILLFSQVLAKFPQTDVVDAILVAGKRNLEEYVKDELVGINSDHIIVFEQGTYFLRHIAACFDNYLEKERLNKERGTRQLYSRT